MNERSPGSRRRSNPRIRRLLCAKPLQSREPCCAICIVIGGRRSVYKRAPGGFPPGAFSHANFALINRSGIEVAVHTELGDPRTLVGDRANRSGLCARPGEVRARRVMLVELRIDNV